MFEIEKSQRFSDSEKMLYNIMVHLEQINKGLAVNKRVESKEDVKADSDVQITNNNNKQTKRR